MTTTIGVKVDESVRERLRGAARQLGCSPHWLHKQALLNYIEGLERGVVPAQIVSESEQHEPVKANSLEESSNPFYPFALEVQPQSVLRAAVTAAYRRPETECVPMIIDAARTEHPEQVNALATRLVQSLRSRRQRKIGGVEDLVQEYDLSSQEGVALMCLAEALLRIPDRDTRDALIRDKVSKGDWRSHTDSPSMFVNAATWGLMITGKLVGVHSEKKLGLSLTKLISRGGEPLIRQGVNTAMRMMGEQFVTGQTIGAALANSRKFEQQGFRYSYDMLGEAATTQEDAQRYYDLYEQAIHAIGKASRGRGIYEGPGISVKLSALHPRYARAQRERVMTEMFPRLLKLAELARQYDIGLNIDAEEADRLDISLDLLEALCLSKLLARWNGIGFVVQAYQKRAPFVLDWIIDLARRSQHRLMIRLVKGAYWDSEIKRAQIDGLEGYPVYTRKIYTDISYLACARKLLAAPDAVFPQFATHNAQTLASIYHMAGPNFYPGQYEFQCLHGMGESLYESVVGSVADGRLGRPCRIYAPVGMHDTLLAYLVRRLLENGANTSFVHQVGDPNVPVETLVRDPVEVAQGIHPLGRPHDKIALPEALYQTQGRQNSSGLDLSNEQRLGSLSTALLNSAERQWFAVPTITDSQEGAAEEVRNPANQADVVGRVRYADAQQVKDAVVTAERAAVVWQATPVQERSAALLKTAQLMQDQMQALMGLLVREAGKTYPNAIAEVREAIDFLRYYATQARHAFANDTHRPLGVVACISPWNFPLAIFTGQIAASLAAGNVVIAKPAEQTNLIAAYAVSLMHQAGVPADALQLLPGEGEKVGPLLLQDPALKGVVFTGSTEVARIIQRTLAQRLDDQGKPLPLIAETGGINVMVVDSSALAEQVVLDVLNSAFDSAGQRCSALRLLCVQEDCADRLLHMLKGAMQCLVVGDPSHLSTDVGPVIDAAARQDIERYVRSMQEAGHRVTRIPLDECCVHGQFVAPTLIEVSRVEDVTREVFGPVLHVVRYQRSEIDDLIAAVNRLGFGLTFGVHTRLDETVAHVTSQIEAGNIYVNRNIVGAVVGVQPFGGEHLSGTGPKAGGPLYLYRLLGEAPEVDTVWAGNTELPVRPDAFCVLPGPTGEQNNYAMLPRGAVWCVPATVQGLERQFEICQRTGNRMALEDRPALHKLVEQWRQVSASAKSEEVQSTLQWMNEQALEQASLQCALFEGDADTLLAFQKRVSERSGPLMMVQGLTHEEIQQGVPYRHERLLREVSTSINTAAVGGNASLMMVG